MIRTLDLFCGGGGSSYGAQKAGAQIVCGIDLWETATATYKDNFADAHVITDRLERISPRKLRDIIGDVDLILASPECTNHTCAKGSAPRSEPSRATAMQALRYAKEFRPRWLILENVVHMRPWSRYDELKENLRELGYTLRECILDASDFGVAQSRRRLFVICDREEDVKPVRMGRRTEKTVREILDPPGTWDSSPLYSPTRAKPTIDRAERGFAQLGRRSSFLLVYYGTDGGGGWQTLDRPLRTVTTIDRFALVEPARRGHEIRMLQVPELKRAMGFGKDYRMNFGTRRDKIKVLGNGVCPPVMQEVVKQLTRH
jgi:DNA (cytosine-5)-methyltransferase 1